MTKNLIINEFLFYACHKNVKPQNQFVSFLLFTFYNCVSRRLSLHLSQCDNGSFFKIATVLRMVRVLRTLRILKLSRYSRGLRILGTTLYRSARVLTLLVMFQMVLAITFGSFVYYLDIGKSFSID